MQRESPDRTYPLARPPRLARGLLRLFSPADESIDPGDPLVYGGVTLVLLLVSGLAAWIPA